MNELIILTLLNIAVLACASVYLWSISVRLQAIEKECAELNKRTVILLEKLGHKIHYIYK